MQPDLNDVRFKVAAARRIMHRAGLDTVDIAGQITARADGVMWVTPMQLFSATTVDDVVAVPLSGGFDEGKITSGAGGCRRSTRRVPT